MGVDLITYRVAIGIFGNLISSVHCISRKICNIDHILNKDFLNDLKEIFLANIKVTLILPTLFFVQAATHNDQSLILILLLLLCCMDVHPNPGPESSDLSIFHLNIRSVRNKLSYLNDIAPDFDIICLTESHLDGNFPDNDLMINGFDFIRRDRSAHGGGILIYVSHKLFIKRLNILESDDNNNEFIWIEIKFKTQSFFLCTVYRSPSQGEQFWLAFEHSIDTAIDINPHIIVVGDLNVDLLVEKKSQT